MRLSYTQNGSGTEIIEENNFYPFGMKHEGYNALAGNPSYNYGYNGKELQKETGWSDYGARMYMADIGRWGVIDPLAETTRRISPYNYAMNNPVMFIDPDGRKAYVPMEMSVGVPVGGGYSRNSYLNSGTSLASLEGGIPTIFTPDAGGASPNYLLDDLRSAWEAKGIYSSISRNGYLTWWTGGAAGNANTSQEMVVHMIELIENLSSDWYGTGGKGNWFFGAGAVLAGVAGGLNSERMYEEGIRRGLSGNYTLTGRNLSLFGKMPATEASLPISKFTKFGSLAGKASFGVGVVMDGIGVYNYYSPGSNNKVHPAKAGLNTTMGAYGLTGAGTIPALLYFGVDAFYPGGWEGYGNDYQSIQSDNVAIIPGFITAPYGSQKF
ncbi:RHS repeat-associated core domain-containing protein [Chryseobacterium oranimense]|uniref:RHS repeat-associated core domain-containing protein n=1 Tax=Chryseobacterium oranimense TaxID=421058 RepID=UPI003CD07F96